MGIPRKIKTYMWISTFFATTALLTFMLQQTFLDIDNERLTMWVFQALIAPAMIIMVVISLRNWKEKNTKTQTFDEMVK